MNKLIPILFASAIAVGATNASAATYGFSFDNVDGTIAGTVSGTIELADGDGTFAATAVVVDSAPVSLGYTLSLDFLDVSSGYTRDFGNSFTVVGGQITAVDFGRLNSTEGLLLNSSRAGGITFLNLFGSASSRAGVIDNNETTLTFTSISAVPLPASLPLLLAGFGGLGLMSRRKLKA